IAGDLLVAALEEAQLREQDVGAGVALGAGDAVVGSVERQDLADLEAAVEIISLGNSSNALLGADGVVGNVDGHDAGRASGGGDAGGEYADRGSLAGAVGAEQTKDLTALDGEGDAVHSIGGRFGVAFDEAAHRDRSKILEIAGGALLRHSCRLMGGHRTAS